MLPQCCHCCVAKLTPSQEKRDYVVKRLRDMGFVIKYVPDSTFYLCVALV